MCNVYLAYGVMEVTAEQLWLVLWNNVWRHHECTLFCLKYWLQYWKLWLVLWNNVWRQIMNAPYFV